MRNRSYSLGKICPCGTPASNRSSSGLCRPCFMAKLCSDPDRGAKISATHKARLKDPANYAQHCEQARRAGLTKRASPELTAKAAQTMRDKIQPLSMTPEALARRDYFLTGRLSGEAKMAWCPAEYRDEYSYLTNTKKFKRAEAKAIIFAQMRKDRERKAANAARPVLTPFERQERALQAGAQIVAKVRVTTTEAHPLLTERAA